VPSALLDHAGELAVAVPDPDAGMNAAPLGPMSGGNAIADLDQLSYVSHECSPRDRSARGELRRCMIETDCPLERRPAGYRHVKSRC
jgi:hypothetical protein